MSATDNEKTSDTVDYLLFYVAAVDYDHILLLHISKRQ